MSSNTPNSQAGHATCPPIAARVPIQCLQRPGPPQGSSRDRRSVAPACIACRMHKIKCSGDSPKCTHCERTGRECVYRMDRRGRLKIITRRCVQMASLLKELRSSGEGEQNARIDELLDAVEEDISDPQPPTPSNFDDDGINEPQGLVDVDSLDLLDEDLHVNERSRATGFVGMNSEVQWLRTLLCQERFQDNSVNAMVLERRGSSVTTGNSEQVSAVTFYLDSDNVDMHFSVDPYELPTPDMAERLQSVYMEKVHDCFPILPKKPFEEQFRKFIISLRLGTALRLHHKWQAILNLMFAIGARHSHLAKASWQTEEEDHLVYQARARRFGWNEATLTQHPDLPQIQVAGMLAFYYLSVGQVSRAWVVVGIALRFAHALGLHVRNEDPSATAPKREVLVRVWWCLYSLERRLSVITGRPSVVVDSCCSVPLPTALPDDQITDDVDIATGIQRPSSSSTASSTLSGPTFTELSLIGGVGYPQIPIGLQKVEANSGSYFKAVVQVDIITQGIHSLLYSAGTMIRSPGELQQDIFQLGQRLDSWAASLPTEFNFQIRRSGVSTPSHAFFRERTLLEFQFCSARILLTRPCLGGLEQSRKEEKGAAASAGFLQTMATRCVDAAKTELNLLPDDPDALFGCEYGPWWSLVHYLMQALTVLLLALSSSSTAFQDPADLASYVKKAVRWLREMQDPLAERAYGVSLNAFQVVANRLSLDISDLWREHASAFPRAGPRMGGVDDDGLGSLPTMDGNAFSPAM